jgi:hypothetical protein
MSKESGWLITVGKDEGLSKQPNACFQEEPLTPVHSLHAGIFTRKVRIVCH